MQMAAIYSNMAAVQLKLGDWPKAIRSADQCLAIDEKNIKVLATRPCPKALALINTIMSRLFCLKALFRRAQAEFSNNDLDKAEASFKKVRFLTFHVGHSTLNITNRRFQVLTLDPSDPAPKAELQKIKERRKELERKSIKELSGMFNRGGLS